MNRLALILLTAIWFAGCTQKADEPPAPEPDTAFFHDENLMAPPDGGDIKIRFRTNKPWKLDFISYKESLNGQLHAREGDAGDAEVIYTAFPNTGADTKSTTFRLTAGRAAPTEITITQEAIGIDLPTEDQVRQYLMRLYEATDGPNWRFKGKWGSDLPLNQWGSEVKYENGRLELNLTEHYLKGDIDLSGCKALVRLRCAKNQITKIDVSDCPLLEHIDATGSGVKQINVNGCHSLKELFAGYNNLTGINVGWCTTLNYLRIENNNLQTLDLSRCVSIRDLSCHTNRLKELEIPYRANLRSLWCYENELRSLDLSNSEWLDMLNCGDNAIEHLDITGCKRLTDLWCYSNRLTELEYADCKETLAAFYCFSNKLRKIDVSGFRRLHELHCSDNDISDINITGCKGLGWLYCAYNQIEHIDFSGLDLDIVARIDVTGNRLLDTDLTPFVHLFHLWCKGTRTGGEIPELFDGFEDFEHDARYEYLPASGTYIDHGYGWWYPGEPEKMSHTR